MSLFDMMAADLAAITSDTTAFAVTGTYTPQGTVTGFSWSGVIGDPASSLDGSGGILNQDLRVPCVGVFSALVTGLTSVLGAARSPVVPVAGDQWVIGSGPNLGIWRVEGWHGDIGDGVTLNLRRQTTAWTGRAVAGAQ